jgi:hypothetical protein
VGFNLFVNLLRRFPCADDKNLTIIKPLFSNPVEEKEETAPRSDKEDHIDKSKKEKKETADIKGLK